MFCCECVRLLALLVGVASLQQEEVVQDQHIFASRHDEWNFGSTTAMGGGARSIVKKVLSVEQAEGVGARVRRSIGGAELRNLDPFLMLDEFKVRKPAGFPDHPHRGFETVTYMLQGSFQHEDFCGHRGTINPGDLQWMTAGRGIVHSEMPGGDGDNVGLQLWINLKGKDKSPVRTRTPTSYLDFKLDPGATVKQPVTEGWNGFIYVIKGKGEFGGENSWTGSAAHHTLVLGPGDHVMARNTGDEQLHFVLIAGEPIKEPIIQHGPFVMNSREQISEAIMDYSQGRNGFERAPGWRSEIALR